MDFSGFGKRFAREIGIGELMDDLADVLVADPAPQMLGGGNPAHLPEVQNLFRQRKEVILSQFGEVFGAGRNIICEWIKNGRLAG